MKQVWWCAVCANCARAMRRLCADCAREFSTLVWPWFEGCLKMVWGRFECQVVRECKAKTNSSNTTDAQNTMKLILQRGESQKTDTNSTLVSDVSTVLFQSHDTSLKLWDNTNSWFDHGLKVVWGSFEDRVRVASFVRVFMSSCVYLCMRLILE